MRPRRVIDEHIERDARRSAARSSSCQLPDETQRTAPSCRRRSSRLDSSCRDLKREVFGPVLHVIRYRREELDRLIDDINATGYGLTFGLHTRLDETIAHVTGRIKAGNIYVNRNIIGAVVGVQPFGGRGLSGTGPKAGRAALYRPAGAAGCRCRRSTVLSTRIRLCGSSQCGSAARATNGEAENARELAQHLGCLACRRSLRGRSASATSTRCIRAAKSCSSRRQRRAFTVSWPPRWPPGTRLRSTAGSNLESALSTLPASVAARVSWTSKWETDGPFSGALVEGNAERVHSVNRRIAGLKGPLVLVQSATTEELGRIARPTASIGCWKRYRHQSTPRPRAAMPAS